MFSLFSCFFFFGCNTNKQIMSKRELESDREDKHKVSKREEIVIDSELLGHQQSDKSENSIKAEPISHEEQAEAEAAVAAANENDPASIALTTQQHHLQHQQQQQSEQQLHQQQQAYQNAYRQQNDNGNDSNPANDNQPHSPLNLNPTTLGPSQPKPPHGSDEWHKQRRENHKEVERRRRESINHGIKELANLIQCNDTNKSQILQRAVDFIRRLKENETNNIEKWTLEKLITEQAVSELNGSNEKLKQELERTYREIEHWKRKAEEKSEK